MRPTLMEDRYGDLARRGFDAPALLEGMDVEGVDVAALFPSYGLYSNEGYPTTFAPELAQRYDAAVNFVRTGGRFGRKDADRGQVEPDARAELRRRHDRRLV